MKEDVLKCYLLMYNYLNDYALYEGTDCFIDAILRGAQIDSSNELFTDRLFDLMWDGPLEEYDYETSFNNYELDFLYLNVNKLIVYWFNSSFQLREIKMLDFFTKRYCVRFIYKEVYMCCEFKVVTYNDYDDYEIDCLYRE